MYVTHMTDLRIAIILTVYVLLFKIPVLKNTLFLLRHQLKKSSHGF